MRNYNKQVLKNQDTWLHISFLTDISDELGNIVPYPQHHYIKGDRIVYCWLLDGFFETTKNIEYLNDIIARFKITFNDSRYLKHTLMDKSNISPLKLRYFQNLKSRAVDTINERNNYDSTRDFIFWCLKFYAEDLIKEKGIFTYSELEGFAMDNFINKAKDNSTLKSKCRSITNYYINNNYSITKNQYVRKNKELVLATRQEQAKKMHTKLAEDTRKKVLNIVTGMFKDEYRKKNGSWNVSKIAKDSGTSRNTVLKYLPKDTLF